MPCGGRKKPFSSKQKKEQLKEKRTQKRDVEKDEYGRRLKHHQKKNHDIDDEGDKGEGSHVPYMVNQHAKPAGKEKGFNPNRYRFHFLAETKEEIEARKKIARQPYTILPEEALELDVESLYQPGSVLDIPKRPAWKYGMSKAQLERQEEQYFKEYIDKVLAEHDPKKLSYMELNLETWRQLWRVLEMSDIILLITDIRHPALHFSPALYDYVTKETKKKLILVLNKVDLVPARLVVAWKEYFHSKFPEVHIVCFSSFPKDKKDKENIDKEDPGNVLRKRRKTRRYTAMGPVNLLKACEGMVPTEVDLTSWHEKMQADMTEDDDDDEEDEKKTEIENELVEEEEERREQHQAYKDGVLTIGCCGYPNVGKSSLINGLMGRKVVSVSKTPGHTKHFQTIFLTPTVKLCDSPGLVFPSLVAKSLQILAGIYPIAQVREPYTAVMYLAERIPNMPEMLHLTHPETEKKGPDAEELNKQLKWSADDICYAFAEKRGFRTAKAARPDVYRAANRILRLALEGRICLAMLPPGYTKEKQKWEEHQETLEILAQQQALGIHGSESEEEEEEGEEFNEKEQASDSEEEEDTEESDDEKSGACGTTTNPFAMLDSD